MVSSVSLQTALDQQSKTDAAKTSLASDFTQFLTLLTTQLQNQDPLSPMDSTEFTNQLVAFSGVEQQINANQKLDNLVALSLSNASSSAQNYVGQEISYVSAEFHFDGAPSEIKYSLPKSSSDTTLRILNEDGSVVYEEEVTGNTGANEFVWNGQLADGSVAPDGTYEVKIDALDDDGKAIQATTVVNGLVRGIETQNGQIYMLVGERAVSLGNVLNSTTPSTNQGANSITTALDYIGLDVTYESNQINLTSSGAASITYTLDEKASRAKIKIYNDTGALVDTKDVNTAKGTHEFVWEPNGLPAGQYSYEIDAIGDNTALLKKSVVSIVGDEDINVAYNLGTKADQVNVKVLNSTGQVVRNDVADTKAGPNTYSWDGKSNSGEELAKGKYTVEITSVSTTDERIPVSSTASGRVTGVETDNGVIFLQIGNTRTLPLSDIKSVAVPPSGGSI